MRRQTAAKAGEKELQVLDYQNTNAELMPLVAAAYALIFMVSLFPPPQPSLPPVLISLDVGVSNIMSEQEATTLLGKSVKSMTGPSLLALLCQGTVKRVDSAVEG